jgi:glycosyltransferase involved in cell wall biosynthesis
MTTPVFDASREPKRARLRILEVAPVWFPTPPPAYGGIEWVVHWLCEGLRARGHDVLLMTIGTSKTKVPKRSSLEDAPARSVMDTLAETVHAIETSKVAEEFQPDVVHDHTLLGPLLTLPAAAHVVTAHGPTDGMLGRYYEAISQRTPLIAISHAQRRKLPSAVWLSTVHNAIDVDAFTFEPDKDDYALFLGRLTPDKGAHIAAAAARRAGQRLVIAGRVEEPQQREYFERRVEPLLGDGIEFAGEADWDSKRSLLAKAKVLLCPLLWDEPFGLVLVEALASGTPVIAFPRGAAPEIIDDGVTGALVKDAAEMARAMGTVDIDPWACREAAAARFDVPKMVEGYDRTLRRAADPMTRPALRHRADDVA